MTLNYFYKGLPLLLALSALLLSCSVQKNNRIDSHTIHTEKVFNQNLIKIILYNQYTDWKDTPHQIGGLSKKGIDCSGLVFLTFKYRFRVDLPRTTTKQARLGKQIAKNNLMAGDLVFFKTGFFNRHVGIFIENNRFLHSSTRHGVMLSSLNDAYWKENYYLAKRIDLK